ncbi:glycerol uptake operon antiterminator [Natronincola peptidivorans]|uniref:Glycerol uptake operon antiterminator n=1 Tax=Natronincola peptidivorans TaxID=426128 RepID=A0A1I0D9N6_9FIRM|nr:glycerol-3-phosphate responsive antiterminator [Natronincola peptidivorans]SET28806.1 glycerol uptake operon antiterminator [Natronincola peptidivorans]
MIKHFFHKAQDNPIIAAVNDLDKLQMAIESPSEIIFLLVGNILNLKEIVDTVKAANKHIYVHLDLMGGFSKDMMALKYINEKIGPDGIITTKSSLIKIAKEMEIFAIQRLFILDSLSLETAIRTIHSAKPDAVELLPGIMPKIIKTVHEKTSTAVVAGGLIQNKEDAIQSVKAGAMAISTSKEEVWYM